MTDETIIRFDPPAAGGGGTPLANGLGISLDTITNPGTMVVNNTGTIVQPAASGTHDGTGILLRPGAPGPNGRNAGNLNITGPNITGVGNYPNGLYGSSLVVYTGDVIATGTAGEVSTGAIILQVGKGVANGKTATGALLSMGNPFVYGTSVYAGSVQFVGGGVIGGTVGVAGDVSLQAGEAPLQGGSVILTPGSGASVGQTLLHRVPTSDPHILDAVWRTTTTNGIILSRG